MAYINQKRQEEIDKTLYRIKVENGLSYPENNLLEIATTLGVAVYEIDFQKIYQKQGINGVIQWDNDKPSIYINKNYTPERKTFTLAHELGHFILHPNSKKYRIDFIDYTKEDKETEEEIEANYFAGSLLVPKEKLLELLRFTDKTEKIAEYFGVSKAVIDTRIKWIQKNNQV